MEPLTYSKFALYRLNEDDVASAALEPFPFVDGAVSRCIGVIDQPACQVVYEDFVVGHEYQWTCWTHELHYVMGGRAEIDYWEAPLFAEAGSFVAEAGCLYLIPCGTRMVWRVLEEPFRRFTVDFPNPGFPLNRAPSLASSE